MVRINYRYTGHKLHDSFFENIYGNKEFAKDILRLVLPTPSPFYKKLNQKILKFSDVSSYLTRLSHFVPPNSQHHPTTY